MVMQRRNFIKWSSLLSAAGLWTNTSLLAKTPASAKDTAAIIENDRTYWVSLLEKIANPILANISKGELRKNMEVKYSTSWDGSNKEVIYMEAFGRLIGGMASWFNLPEDNSAEGQIRKRLHAQTLKGIAHGFNPESPDYFCWGEPKTTQPLVDASYIAHAFIRAPKALWEPLSETTKKQVIYEFKTIRQIKPHQNNWVLFAAIIESFLLTIGEEVDTFRIDNAIDSIQKWYLGDGFYGDGNVFHFDHYNGYVIQPMLLDVLRINVSKGRRPQKEYDNALKRMQRYAQIQERFISPEGTYPVIGRSSTYRMAAFQPIAQLALEQLLPKEIKPAQVRCALTAVMKRMFIPSTFTPKGWLEMGLIGDQQEGIVDYYSNSGSMYITSLVFLPLGLPVTDPFWKAPFTEWTSRKAWSGKPFDRDHAID